MPTHHCLLGGEILMREISVVASDGRTVQWRENAAPSDFFLPN
jgi:hypothetical protein